MKCILAFAGIYSTPGNLKIAVSLFPPLPLYHGVWARAGGAGTSGIYDSKAAAKQQLHNGNSFIWNDSFVMSMPQIVSSQYWIFHTIVRLLFDLVEGGNLLESTRTIRDHTVHVAKILEFVDTIANLDIATIVESFANKEESNQQGSIYILF